MEIWKAALYSGLSPILDSAALDHMPQWVLETLCQQPTAIAQPLQLAHAAPQSVMRIAPQSDQHRKDSPS